ncbi:hypothetical protein scyTo_0025260 [Scyliorhinus torazame]|uniref:Uncharacterized protein n=1 Tax=Scyliorhinus torazame TaxID=75743 RepID=A0A401QH00_SCYTO|nr:hypothetical protein [Scyliorhinus torazame]
MLNGRSINRLIQMELTGGLKNYPIREKGGMGLWKVLERLRQIYNLLPQDEVQDLTLITPKRESDQLFSELKGALEEEEQRMDDGWLRIKQWLLRYNPPEIDWTKVTACLQKRSGSVRIGRLRKVWIKH